MNTQDFRAMVREALNTALLSMDNRIAFSSAGLYGEGNCYADILEAGVYDVPANEIELLPGVLNELFGFLGKPDWLTIIEPAIGNSPKSSMLARAAAQNIDGPVQYIGLDVDAAAASEAVCGLNATPGVEASFFECDYTQKFPIIKTCDEQKLVFFPGSSFGNFSKSESAALLRHFRRQVRPGDHLLIGLDRGPTPERNEADIVRAYSCPATINFYLEYLHRLNRECNTDIRFLDWKLITRFDPQVEAVVTYFEATRPLEVEFFPDESDEVIFLARQGFRMHIEQSRKFDPATVRKEFMHTGWEVCKIWASPKFLYVLAEARDY